jgi:large-conductance mechanosensitive channel
MESRTSGAIPKSKSKNQKYKNKIGQVLHTNFDNGRKVAMQPVQKFLFFLENRAILSLAFGVIIADTVKQLVNSVVDGLIRPFIALLLPRGDEFSQLNIPFNGVVFKLGDVVSAFLQTFIIFVILYIFLAWILRKEELLGTTEKPKK